MMFFYLRVFGFFFEMSGLFAFAWLMYVSQTGESLPLYFGLLYSFSLAIKEANYIYHPNAVSQFFAIINSIIMTFSFIVVNTILYFIERETYDVTNP